MPTALLQYMQEQKIQTTHDLLRSPLVLMHILAVILSHQQTLTWLGGMHSLGL